MPLGNPVSEAPRPYTLVAELSYRCPLSCGYCSNPLAMSPDDVRLLIEALQVNRSVRTLALQCECWT